MHDAVSHLREISSDMGCGDGDLLYKPLPAHHVCQFCHGGCMGVEYGGCVAKISSSDLFSARVSLDHLFEAPLKSKKTRVAAAGALTVVAGFLMLTRKLTSCLDVNFDSCLNRLVDRCAGKLVYIIGNGGTSRFHQTLFMGDADLVVITGDALTMDSYFGVIEEGRSLGKEILFLGPEWAGVAALLGLEHWCPYGT